MITISQGQRNGTEKVSSRKLRKSKFDVTGELLDKLIGMQEKSDKMLLELEMKRAQLEEKQIEMDVLTRREERQFQLQMMNILTCNNQDMLPPGIPCIIPNAFYLWVWWL